MLSVEDPYQETLMFVSFSVSSLQMKSILQPNPRGELQDGCLPLPPQILFSLWGKKTQFQQIGKRPFFFYILYFLMYLFIYLAALGLCCCAWVFSG